MKRHLHLAMGLSSVLLAACCLAGAGLAWLRAAVGAVARTALLCTVSEPVQVPEPSMAVVTGRISQSPRPCTGYWFGPTLSLDGTPGVPEQDNAPAFDTATWIPGPPGTVRAGPWSWPLTGTET